MIPNFTPAVVVFIKRDEYNDSSTWSIYHIAAWDEKKGEPLVIKPGADNLVRASDLDEGEEGIYHGVIPFPLREYREMDLRVPQRTASTLPRPHPGAPPGPDPPPGSGPSLWVDQCMLHLSSCHGHGVDEHVKSSSGRRSAGR